MNPMQAVQLIVREWIAGRGRLWRSASGTARYAVLGLGLAGAFPGAAKQPDATGQTNDAAAAQVLSQLGGLVQGVDPAQPEDMAPPDGVASTNGPAGSNGQAASADRTNRVNRFDNSGRSQSDDRRSRGRRSYRSKSNKSNGSGSANDYSRDSDRGQLGEMTGTNAGPATLDYASFKLIVDRNIFDPNRYAHKAGAPRVAPRPKSIDYVTLVGTMSYEKGTFAFFDGTSSEYKKALKLTDSIVGYKVTNIAPNTVKLVSGTNEVELSVGGQLRREEDGPWRLTSQPASYATAPVSGSTSGAAAAGSEAASSGADSEVIKRLMQRREKE